MTTSSDPLVSVIVPTYNEEADITQVMEALANLTYRPVEIVVVDDASQDRTLEIVQRYKGRIENLVILPQAVNRGVAAARNVGLREAKGEIVIILNADVLLESDFIERIIPHYQQGADYLLVDAKVMNEGLYPRYIQAQHEYCLRDYSDLQWTEGYSCRREAALAVGGFPEEFPSASGEDAVFGDRMKARYRRAIDFTIVVPHIAPPDLNEFWKQRRGRGRGGAYRLYAYEKRPLRWGSVTRSVLGTWGLAFTLIAPLIYAMRLTHYSPRGKRDWLSFTWVRLIEMLATAAGYWRGCREIARQAKHRG
jgi:glycosyltransferase involved in cell wall biosynthesis